MTQLSREGGYTLVESLVAMVLFGAVLIPLVQITGSLMFDHRNIDTYQALLLAEAELNRIVVTHDFSALTETTGHFVVRRTVDVQGPLVSINVAVASVRAPGRPLVELTKAILPMYDAADQSLSQDSDSIPRSIERDE